MIKIYVNPYDAKPLYRQIADGIANAIANGELKKAERLPTVRALAVELGVNPNTVARAYRELEREGVVETFTGKGTFVSEKTAGITKSKLDKLIRAVAIEANKKGISLEELCKKIKERSDER